MILKNRYIYDIDSWFQNAPPMGGEKQWKDGRSAKELARYMTAYFPNIPKEIEVLLSDFIPIDAEIDFAAEYVTDFAKYGLGRGEGRNHDAFMWANNTVVGIEGKADEPLGSHLLCDAARGASNNKMHRINGMSKMIFGDSWENHKNIRYQLLTAASATLLEAYENNAENAILLVLVFKKDGCYSEEKIQNNNKDIDAFLLEAGAQKHKNYYYIPTAYGDENNIKLYFKKIKIRVYAH